jgi:cold shock CspA family protein
MTTEPTGPQLRGVVRYWNDERRYGKIAADRVTYFVHGNDLVDVVALRRGQQVRFQSSASPRGPHAVNVRPLQRLQGSEARP